MIFGDLGGGHSTPMISGMEGGNMHFKYKSLPLVTSVNVQADYSPPIVNTHSHLNEL